jgi:DNA-directed RNA polymerase
MRTLYRQQRQKLRKSLVTSAKDTNDGSSSGVSEALASDAADAEPSVAIESLQTKQSQQQVSAEAAAIVAQESQGWLTTIMSKLKHSVNSSTDAARAAVDPGIVNPEWSDQFTMQVQARLGAVVLTILLRSCTIESPSPRMDGAADTPSEEMKPIPAFYHAYLHSKMKRIGIIKATDAVYHHIEMAGEYVETMHPRHQPMVARPLPWTSAEQVIVWWSVCGGHI